MIAASARTRISILLAVILVAATLPFGVHATVAKAVEDSPDLPYELAPSNPSEPKVFAHYFPPYPVSIDNDPPETDYYTQEYLDPHGEDNKHLAYGGLLRDRPAPQEPVDDPDWKSRNMEKEVNQAADAGLDGFFIDILGVSGLNWDRTILLMEAVEATGRPIVIVPQVDPTASAGEEAPAEIAAKMAELAAMPAAYHLPTGEFVLSAFKAEEQSVSWWADIITILEVQHGIPTVFMPVFLDASYMDAFADISVGVGNWGVRNPGSTEAGPDYAADAHALGLKWIQPVSVQDTRPKGGVYWEARNLAQLRASWTKAIDDGADIAMLNTWNDYSEHTSFAPSLAHGHAFNDVSGYYSTRFKTGEFPQILRDGLYLTHRKQPYAALPQLDHDLQELKNDSRDPAQDTVEVMSFLTAPATVTITTGDGTTTFEAPAGVHQFSAPLALGDVQAAAIRNGLTVASTTTGVEVVDSPPVQDLQYYAAGSLRSPAAPPPPDLDITPPSAPTDLAADVDGGDVTLTWTGSTDNVSVTGYRVERSETGTEWITLETTTETSYTDIDRPVGLWHYRVRATDAAGNISAASDAVEAGISDGSLPGVPTGLAAKVVGYRVLVTWNAVNDAAASGYRLERSPAGSDEWTVVADTVGTTYVDIGTRRTIGEWFYRVSATNAVGASGVASQAVSARIVDVTMPTAPKRLAAEVSGNSVTLAWFRSIDNVGVTAYRVERSPDGVDGWMQIASTTSQSYIDYVATGQEWFYRISATDAAGNLSRASLVVSGAVPDDAAPTAPTGLSAAITGSTVSLTWNAASDDVAVTGYRVERSASGTDGWTELASTSGTGYIDQAQPGETWFYRVLALDAAGNVSPASPVVQATLTDSTPPTTPTGLSAQIVGNDTYLSWAAASDDVGVTGYRVERSATGSHPWNQIAVTSDTHYTDVNRLGEPEFYRVFAVDATGNNSAPSDVVQADEGDGTPPTAPTSLAADVVGDDVVLTWTMSTDDDAVAGYQVERSANGVDGWQQIGVSNSTGYTDGSPPIGQWFYRVIAVDTSGNSSTHSATASAVVADTSGPTTPTGVAATVVGYDVALSWTASSDNVAVTNYRVERAASGSDNWIQIATPASPFLNDPVRPAGVWAYRITAVDAAGNNSPASSTVEAVVGDITPPTTPTGLVADVFLTRVTLTWNASSDNTAVTGYLVERSASGSESWTELGTATETSFIENDVPPGTWSYRVTAIDAAGNRSTASAAQAFVSDLGRPTAPTGLTATVTGHEVALTWGAASDNVAVTGYRVERSETGTGDWVQLARPAATNYTDSERPVGTWYYRVTATDAAGNVGPPSTIVTATVADSVGEPQLISLIPSADSYVHQAKPNENFGTLNQMFSLGPDPQLLSYLQFDLPAAPAGTSLTSAVLRLRTTTSSGSGSPDIARVSLVEGSWDEQTITYNERPAVTDTVLGETVAAIGDDAYFDVVLSPALLQSHLGSPTSVALFSPSGTGNNMFFWSADHTVENYRPHLALTFN